MSQSSHVRTIRLPLRKLCSTFPAAALIGCGILLPASAAPIAAGHVGLTSTSSPAIVVPDAAVSMPNAAQDMADHARQNGQKSAADQPFASMLPRGIVPGSSSMVTLDNSGIPERALGSYRKAATLISSADPACHIDWALLGAIGRVESDHARFGGNQLDAGGVTRPGIFGVTLNGANGTALISDTDHGLLDRDTTFDRAVGPMQFIPGTWRLVGVDANGDGVKNPQDIADAAATTAVYLCSGRPDLSRPTDLRSAILRYNASDSYVSTVTAIANAYRHGVRALPASVLTPVSATTAVSRTHAAATRHASRVSVKAASAPKAKTTGHKPALPPAQGAGSASVVAQTRRPQSTTPKRAQPMPATTCVPIPSPTGTASPTSTSTAAPSTAAPTPGPPTMGSPRTSQTCLPTCASSTSSPTSTPSSGASPITSQTCPPPCTPTTAPSSSTSTTSVQPCLSPTDSTSPSKATP